MKPFDLLYDQRPDKSDSGGWGYSNLLNLYAICDMVKPSIIIISGHRTGQTAYLCHHFTTTVTFGDRSKLIWQSEAVGYSDSPLEEITLYEPKRTLFIFDDDIPHLQRLEYLLSVGAQHAVFNNNEPAGQVRRLHSPTTPTLEEMRFTKHPLFNQIALYSPLPFHSGTYDTKICYIEL